jgi:outer membrane cobalamin receptor
MKLAVITLLFCISIFGIYAQSDSVKTADEIDLNTDMGLEELMNVKITVASQNELSIDQTPAIVSVITQEDIKRIAPKDMLDILRTIPGFQFAADVNSEIGLGVRGLNAIEGKVLVMLDGLQMNENLYGTTQWIGHFDVNQIDKIEISRGPGYGAYNGFAGLAVINIITKKAEDLQGIQVAGTYSRLSNSLGRQQLSISTGAKHKDFYWKASLYTGEMYRGEGLYTDLDSSSIELNKNKNSYIMPTQGYVTLGYKNLEVKYLHDNYYTNTPFHLDLIMQQPAMSNFENRQIDVVYKWKVSDKWILKPRYNFIFNRPYISNQYDTTNTIPGYYVYDHDNYRSTYTLNSQYKFSESIQLNGGVGYFMDESESHARTYNPSSVTEDTLLEKYFDINHYLELFVQRPTYTISAGYRFEHHSSFGNVFLPRFAATKQWKKFNFKAAYSHAFRAPLTENILANPDIKPEITKVAEFQIGYKFNKNFIISLNVFDNHVSNLIVYDNVNGQDNFYNFKQFGSHGVEFESVYSADNLTITGNYSYYVQAHKDVVKYNSLNNSYLAFSPHKFNLSAKQEIIKNLDFTAGLCVVGKRYAYTYLDSLGDAQQTQLNPTFIWNTTLTYRNVANSGLTFQLGVYDLTNCKYVFVQAYNGGKAPFRATGREVLLKVSYAFKKKND